MSMFEAVLYVFAIFLAGIGIGYGFSKPRRNLHKIDGGHLEVKISADATQLNETLDQAIAKAQKLGEILKKFHRVEP